MRALLLAVLMAVPACSPEPAEAPSPRPVPDEVTGTITSIERQEGRIAAFTVVSGDTSLQVAIDSARDYGFDLEHLEEHRQTGDPVRVTLEEREGVTYAVEILDA